MRYVLLLLLYAGVVRAESNTLIVQSYNFTSNYEDSIVRELLSIRGDNIDVLFIRDTQSDRSVRSKEFIAERVSNKAAPYDNLIVLGFEDGYFRLPDKEPFYYPILADAQDGESLRYRMEALLELFTWSAEAGSVFNGTIHVLNDDSDLSRRRFAVFTKLMFTHRHIKIESYTARTDVELKGILMRLNSHNTKPAALLNNIFSLPSQDAYAPLRSSDVDRLIISWNKKHIEVGPLKEKQLLGMGIGVPAETLAASINESINTGKKVPYETGIVVNLSRVRDLGYGNLFLLYSDHVFRAESSYE